MNLNGGGPAKEFFYTRFLPSPLTTSLDHSQVSILRIMEYKYKGSAFEVAPFCIYRKKAFCLLCIFTEEAYLHPVL